VPADGALSPVWDVGRLTPQNEPRLSAARLWIDGGSPLDPGGCAPVRLLPQTFEDWRQLTPGDVITMHEGQAPVGTARIVKIVTPAPA
jgi:hypothetical protein